jgi:dTDP-glucose pyrophosphorylase
MRRISWWGVIPAAGAGSRIQPLAFSKELLPVGSRIDHGTERPRAVSEYLVERLLAAGVRRLCFVIGRAKSDILEYYGGHVHDTPICYVVQDRPGGLCDAVFRAAPLIARRDGVILGLPDTIWFPVDAPRDLPEDRLSLVLFPVEQPQFFDAVSLDADGLVREVQVKSAAPATRWIWGAIGMPGSVYHDLLALWERRQRQDEYLGTLINAYLARGGRAAGLRRGDAYVDVGTLHGYRHAMRILERAAPAAVGLPAPEDAPPPARPGQSLPHEIR